MAASLLSWICHLIAHQAGQYVLSTEMELPVISTAFYPGALLVYLFPLPLLIGAAIYSVWHRKNADLGLLLVTINLSTSIIFMAAFALAMLTPYARLMPQVRQA